MAPTFFAQLAAGCLLVVGMSDIRASGWKYLRLMVYVSLAAVFVANPLVSWSNAITDDRVCRGLISQGVPLSAIAHVGLAAFLALFLVWLIRFASRTGDLDTSQRTWLVSMGLACLAAAIALACRPDAGLPGSRLAIPVGGDAVRTAIDTTLGALMLGGVTAGMLLGHRYLTDTEMPIAALRRLTTIYLCALGLRIAWATVMAWPICNGTFTPSGGALWFWVVLTLRAGVGLIGAAIFAWMIRDCVKSRSTQSATAIFYLSMVFVYLGELAAQYLLRTEGIAI